MNNYQQDFELKKANAYTCTVIAVDDEQSKELLDLVLLKRLNKTQQEE